MSRALLEAIRAMRARDGRCAMDACRGTAEHEALVGCPACGSTVWLLCCDHASALEQVAAEGRLPRCDRLGGAVRLVALEDLRPH